MKPLFESTDGNGDSVKVHPWSTPAGSHQFLAVQVLQGLDDSVALLSRSEVVKLYDVLGTWLGEAPHPVADTVTRSELAAAMDQLRAELRPPAVPGWVHAPVITRDPMTPEEVWGPDCVTCGHSSGVHTTLHGCGAAVQGGGFCPCAVIRWAS